MNNSLRYKVAALIGLWALIWIAYSSGFTAEWYVDDLPNIVRNEKIHLTQLDFKSIVDTFFAGPSGELYRPVPMASFALNWYINGSSVLGYRLVNILIHCINGFLLYLVVLNLLQTPRLINAYNRPQLHWIAFLSSVFWALNPMQIQAVTYIVQRMTSMAALFFLSGIYFYLRYRNNTSGGTGKVFLAATISCYLLAVFSKENAILFPINIYLIATIFFTSGQQRDRPTRQLGLPVVLVLLTLAIGIGFFILLRGDPFQFFEELYGNRPFTAFQRLLTEFRILLVYLSQLFFPIPSRLSFCHDITISTSLFEPWTTLPAILLVGAALFLAIKGHRKKPLISFAILFFFLNHGVESTIVPLELIFEHRNYLPSFFLFFPLANWIVIRLHKRLRMSSIYGNYIVAAFTVIIIALLCNWTIARNLVWRSSKSLWEDEIAKNPKLARPYHNLAWGYYQARGQYKQALELYRSALSHKASTPLEVASTLNNMGRIYYLIGDYDQALQFLEKSIGKHPHQKIAEYQIVMTLIQMSRWQESIQKIESGLKINESDWFYLKLNGIVLSRMGDSDRAVSFLYSSLNRKPDKVDTLAHLCIELSRMGRFDEAASLFAGNKGGREARNPLMVMSLSEMERLRGNTRKSDKLLDDLIHHQGIEKVREMLLVWRKDNLSININYDYYLMKINLMGKN